MISNPKLQDKQKRVSIRIDVYFLRYNGPAVYINKSIAKFLILRDMLYVKQFKRV
jgi:hypothetical protein